MVFVQPHFAKNSCTLRGEGKYWWTVWYR